MAELNLNFQPEWLTPKEGSKLMSLAEAFQLKQQKRQVDMQAALLPLKQQEMQANIANAALDQQIKQEQMAIALQIKANDAEGWKRASQVKDWIDPAQVGQVYEAGPYSPGFTRFIEGRQQSAEMFSARQSSTEARLEGLRDTLSTREALHGASLQAAKERTDAAIASREHIAQENVALGREIKEERAAQAVLRHNRMLLNMGKQVTRDEFITRTINTYVRATGKTPEEAAAAVGKIYDEFIAAPRGESGPVNPKDPINLFPQ